MPDLHYISEPLRSFALPIDSLLRDPRNARLHPDRNIHGIRKSLRQFGQMRPIVLQDDGRTVIAGNGTLEAAELEGWTHIAAVTSSLSGRDATAYGLADNRTAETAEWDFERVGDLIRELKAFEYDIESLGWSGVEIESLLSGDVSGMLAEQNAGQTYGSNEPRQELKYIPLDDDQVVVVNQAVEKVRKTEQDPTIKIGRALELIFADWGTSN